MTTKNPILIALLILFVTGLSGGYGLGVKAQFLPFSAKIGFSQPQWSFLRGWVKLALVAGVLLPVILLIQSWEYSAQRAFWDSYLLVVALQLISERLLSQWLVPSIVVPLGFFYTVFRLWQLLDGYIHFTFSGLTMWAFLVVLMFWAANLVMLMGLAIPAIYVQRDTQN